jgi:hypothetical protein
MSVKKTVFFKKITQSKKGVVFCVNKPTAQQVAQSGKSTQVNFKLGGATVTGRKAFHNFGQQYFVQLDCSKLTKTQLPKVGDEFQIVVTDKPVINQSTGEAMPNLKWGYAG